MASKFTGDLPTDNANGSGSKYEGIAIALADIATAALHAAFVLGDAILPYLAVLVLMPYINELRTMEHIGSPSLWQFMAFWWLVYKVRRTIKGRKER